MRTAASVGTGAGESFTVWDCLTASLTAMLIDNLPTGALEGSASNGNNNNSSNIGPDIDIPDGSEHAAPSTTNSAGKQNSASGEI